MSLLMACMVFCLEEPVLFLKPMETGVCVALGLRSEDLDQEPGILEMEESCTATSVPLDFRRHLK
jgi:hypothetical protein